MVTVWLQHLRIFNTTVQELASVQGSENPPQSCARASCKQLQVEQILHSEVLHQGSFDHLKCILFEAQDLPADFLFPPALRSSSGCCKDSFGRCFTLQQESRAGDGTHHILQEPRSGCWSTAAHFRKLFLLLLHTNQVNPFDSLILARVYRCSTHDEKETKKNISTTKDWLSLGGSNGVPPSHYCIEHYDSIAMREVGPYLISAWRHTYPISESQKTSHDDWLILTIISSRS